MTQKEESQPIDIELCTVYCTCGCVTAGISSTDGSGVYGSSGSSRGVTIGVKTSCRVISGDVGGDRSTNDKNPIYLADRYAFNFKRHCKNTLILSQNRPQKYHLQ